MHKIKTKFNELENSNRYQKSESLKLLQRNKETQQNQMNEIQNQVKEQNKSNEMCKFRTTQVISTKRRNATKTNERNSELSKSTGGIK